jgi:hypothetical protein
VGGLSHTAKDDYWKASNGFHNHIQVVNNIVVADNSTASTGRQRPAHSRARQSLAMTATDTKRGLIRNNKGASTHLRVRPKRRIRRQRRHLLYLQWAFGNWDDCGLQVLVPKAIQQCIACSASKKRRSLDRATTVSASLLLYFTVLYCAGGGGVWWQFLVLVPGKKSVVRHRDPIRHTHDALFQTNDR